MKDMPAEEEPVRVPERAKQAGEVRARWAWAEPAVWTARMLAALEEGVKGGVWFSLIDKVYALRALQAAFKRVKANRGAAGVDHVTVGMYESNLEANLEGLSERLRRGEYEPQGIRRVEIPKEGSQEKRPLGIPTVRDRVAQTALRNALEPIFERDFAEQSYGFRPGRGCHDALRRVEELLRAGQVYVVDADLKSYFDTIPHEGLMERVRAKVADGRVLSLVEAYLTQKVMEGMKGWTPKEGTPQGAVISPLLSNIYLDPLDQMMAEAGWEMVRYADDFVTLCRSEAEAREALGRVQGWTAEAGLTLHPEKTRIVDAREPGGFDFLGYHFEKGYHWPSKKSLGKLKEKIRGKTRRLSGRSLKATISDVNRSLKGWFEYFQHSQGSYLAKLDGWVRMRLRSILRKQRRKVRGRAKGADNQRWPNAYFAEQGLFSLEAARVRTRRSVNR